MGEIVTPRWRVSPAGGICSTSSRRKIFPFSRHSAISLDIPEDAPSASLYRRKASPRIPRTCSAAGFELEIIPVAFTTSSPAGIFLVTSSQPLRLFGTLSFDAMQPLQFFFLLAQLVNHPLHRCRHERRRIFRAGSARLEFLFLLLPPAPERFPH